MYTDAVMIAGGAGAIGKALCSEFQAPDQCVVANGHPSDLPSSKPIYQCETDELLLGAHQISLLISHSAHQ